MNVRGSRTRHLLAALVVAAVALGGAACGSSGSDSPDEGSSSETVTVAARTDSGTTEADLKKAAEALAAFNLDSSPDSYAYLSGTCAKKFSSSEWATNLEQIVSGLKSVLPAMATAKVGTVTTRNVTPVSAEVQVVYLDSDGAPITANADQWNAWVVEDGVWVTNDCASAKDLLTGG